MAKCGDAISLTLNGTKFAIPKDTEPNVIDGGLKVTETQEFGDGTADSYMSNVLAKITGLKIKVTPNAKTYPLLFTDEKHEAKPTAKYKNEPVVIECPSVLDFTAVDKHRVLPNDIWKTEFVFGNCAKYKDELAGKNVAVFIGSHSVFSKEEENAISEFAKSWDAPVFCDHTSSYHGDNKILSPQAAFLLDGIKLPDLIIDIGGVTGDYFASGLFPNAEVWRVFAPGGVPFTAGMIYRFLKILHYLNVCFLSQ